jgi:hypothetical protein
VLLNIDRSTERPHCTLATASAFPIRNGTPYKPIGKLGRDGGWFAVDSELEARATAREQFAASEFILCQHC